MSLSEIRHIVLSGKGGVGKSSVTAQLALSLSLQGYNIGVLDIDLTGPSIPRMFAVEDAKVGQSPQGWQPITAHSRIETEAKKIGSLHLMSLGFLLQDRGDAVIWRGPKKTAMIRQLLSDVHWGALDYLLIDTPPGTSDEHISLLETLFDKAASASFSLGAVVVTTPQTIATADVRKSINFCKTTGLKVIGLIENMSGFVCPHCSECTDIFQSQGGQLTARDFNVRFLGKIPVDPEFGSIMEGVPLPSTLTGRQQNPRTNVSNETGRKHADVDHSALLVWKYQRCSLAPILEKVANAISMTSSSAEIEDEQ